MGFEKQKYRKTAGFWLLWCAALILLAVELHGRPTAGQGYGTQEQISSSQEQISSSQEQASPDRELASASREVRNSDGGEGKAVRKTAEKKYIALTFDDGPHPVYTPKLLEGLRKRQVKASFFLIGQSIEGNEDIVRQMYEDGHLIGNHSQNHMQLTKESVGQACQQIDATSEKIREITGVTPSYVRPPFGSWNDDLGCMVPMTVALWNLDPLDWQSQNKNQVVRHVIRHAENGSIVLLHDVYETSVDAALEIIDTLTEEGYNFVTIDELLID